MGRFFALTLDMTGEPKTKSSRQNTSSKTKSNSRIGNSWGVLVLLLLVVFGVMYIFTVNSTATKGYEITELQQKLVDLKESNKRLELQAAELKSITNIEDEVKTLNLVPSKEVKYMSSSEYALNK